jgi:hypothetical protein
MPVHWILVAANPVGESLKNYQKHSFSFQENWFVLVVIGGIVALAIGLYYWDKYRKQFIRRANSEGSPKSLFLDLCNLHELTRAQCALVRHAGEVKQLADPTLTFLDPDILRQLGRGNGGDSAAYAELQVKLFGQPQSKIAARETADADSPRPAENVPS